MMRTLPAILIACSGSLALADDPEKVAPTRPGVSFVVVNDEKERGTPAVRGAGDIPLHILVSDNRSNRRGLTTRRLRVFLAVMESAAPDRVKAGRLVKTYLDPDIMTSTTPTNAREYEMSIPMPKGGYVVHVYLCDPDAPFFGDPVSPSKVDPKLLPGQPCRVTAIGAYVD